MIRILSIAVFLMISVMACKTSETATSNASTETDTAVSTNNTSSSDQQLSKEEMERLYWARLDSAKMNFTEAEVKFMTGMIGHHAQALIMSELAPKNNAGPAVQRLAARIINAQNDEIKTMQTWLKERDQTVPMVHIEGLTLMLHGAGGHEGHDMGGMDHSKMAGMLTQEQLVELSEAKGTEFDRKFLTYMIQHHSGAITMVQDLLNSEAGIQDETAFKVASEINVDQITEIERMRLMLTQIPDPENELSN